MAVIIFVVRSVVLLQSVCITDPYTRKLTYLSNISCDLSGSVTLYRAWLDNNGRKIGELRIALSVGLQPDPENHNMEDGGE